MVTAGGLHGACRCLTDGLNTLPLGLHGGCRYLTDGLNTLPMGLLSRVVATNDTLMALVPLLDQPPWTRRRCLCLDACA